jgi:acetyl-CoA carboxylase alpha subunit
MKGFTIILKKSLSKQVRYQVNTSMEIKEQISKIKQKRRFRKIWNTTMATMWDSRKSYKQQQDIFVIDYYDRIISERHNQSPDTHKLDQLWHQLKKK